MRVIASVEHKMKGDVVGYYNEHRIRNGQEFDLLDPSHFSPKWMKKVEEAPQYKAPQQNDGPSTLSESSKRRTQKIQDAEVI